MPSESAKQHKFMNAVAHGMKPRGGKGPSKKVAAEFVSADKAAGKYAAGGEVIGREMTDHFIMRSKDGHHFAIPKDEHADYIRQHYAEGGEVDPLSIEELAKGTSGDPQAADPLAAIGNLFPGGPADDPVEDALNNLSNDQLSIIVQKTQDPALRSVIQREMEGRAGMLATPEQRQQLAQSFGQRPGMGDVQQVEREVPPPTTSPVAAEQVTGPDLGGAGVLLPGGEAPPAPAFPAPSPAPSVLPSTGGATSGGVKTDMDRLAESSAGAFSEEARAAEAKAGADVAAQDWFMKRSAEIQQDFAQRYQENQQRQEALYQGMLNAHIDPRRVFHRMTTGQKIAAAIGLALGGIGSGLTHGQNVAIQAAEKAISDDIDAQKEEIGTKKSLLTFHMQQGHDILAAQQLAKADLLTVTAAQISRNAASFSGQTAQQAAILKSNEVRQNAMMLTQKVYSEQMSRAVQAEQIKASKMSQAMQAFQMQASMRMLNAQQQAASGQPLTASQVAGLPTQEQARYAAVGPDAYRPALSVEAAKEIAKAQDSVFAFQGLINDMRQHRKKFGSANPLAPAKMSVEKSKARAMQSQLFGPLRSIMGLGVLSEADKKLLEGMVPDVSEFMTTDEAVFAKLDRLQQMVNDQAAGIIRSRLLGSAGLPRITPSPAR